MWPSHGGASFHENVLSAILDAKSLGRRTSLSITGTRTKPWNSFQLVAVEVFNSLLELDVDMADAAAQGEEISGTKRFVRVTVTHGR
jgi:hypothetical protein